MPRFMVVAFGVDQPGVIAAISSVLVEQGCNLADTQMAVLQGYASMMIVVDGPASLEPHDLRAALADGCVGLGHTFSVQPISAVADRARTGSRWQVTIYASDRPGIVFEVTRVLAGAGINILSLQTRLAGHQLGLWMEADIPAGTDGHEVAGRLDRLGRELGLSCSMRPLPESETTTRRLTTP